MRSKCRQVLRRNWFALGTLAKVRVSSKTLVESVAGIDSARVRNAVEYAFGREDAPTLKLFRRRKYCVEIH